MWPFTAWNAKALVDNAILEKRNARAAAIDAGLRKAGGVPPDGRDDDIQYIEASATRIVENIRSRQWTCLRVMQAFVRSAATAHAQTNCLTEVLFCEALDAAEILDKWARRASDDELSGKDLLGLPVSLKDQLDVKGIDTTMGFVRYCNEPAKMDASITTILRENGAIPFCKTNIPQTMLAFECSNPLFGKTTNPYSPLHAPGGSSGGEAALLALNGSPLGIGSDIGGSLRIPAHYSGCYALKPVYGRIPSRGARATTPGFEGVRSTLGPMGRSVEDLELCLRAIVKSTLASRLHTTESHLLPLPYRDVELPQKLRFGYFIEDGFIPTSPACDRAVHLAIQAVQAAGHECIPIKLATHVDVMEVFQALASSDAFSTLTSHLATKEPREASLFLPTLGPRLPWFIRSFIAWILRSFTKEQSVARLFRISHEKSTTQVWQWQDKRNKVIANVRRYLWEELALDAVICPVQAVPAVTHGATAQLSPLAIQTIFWNVVDSTVGVVPVSRVDARRDALPAGFSAKISSSGTPILSKLCYDTVYNADEMDNLPVGVQIAAPAWEEERVLKLMRVVDDALTKQRGTTFRQTGQKRLDRVY